MIFKSKDYDIAAWGETLDDKQRFRMLPKGKADKSDEHQETYKYDDNINHWKDNGLKKSYLEVEEGKSFRIRIQVVRPEIYNADLQVAVKIDGSRIPGIAMLNGERKGEISTMLVDTGIGMEEADLAFTALARTEDENQVEVSGPAITQLSKIELVIRQGRYRVNKDRNLIISNPKVGIVHEKEKKLGSTIHAVNSRAITPALTYTFAPQRSGSPVCRLIWTYHTRTQLQAMGIIKEDIRRPMQERRDTNIPAPSTSTSRSLKRDPGTPVRRTTDAAKRAKFETLRKIKKEQSGRIRPAESQNQPVFFSESNGGQDVGVFDDLRMITDLTGDSD